MENDNFTATWICSTFEEKSEGQVLCGDIYNNYSVECHKRSIECMPKNNFMKILLRLYPTTRTSYVRLSGGRKYMYKGICYNNFSESKTEIVQLTNIQNYLDGSCFLMSRTVDCAKICMPTEIFTNGNMIFKEIILDFSKNKWMLKVSGKLVDFSRLGISDDFDNSEHNLNVILLIVKRLKMCTGIDVIHKKTIPTYIMPENISFSQDENKMLKKMRCSTCKRVLDWLTVGDACYTCRKNLNSFKNTGQENLINLEKTDETDLSKILEFVFPNANPEMQIFLKNQHDVLSVKDARSRRWEKSVIKKCVSLWSRSPAAYQDLKDSNLFILPSGGLLQRYKNITAQNPGVNAEIFKWMFNTAKSLNIPPPGYYGGIIHDEAKIQEDLVFNVKGKENKLIGWVDTGEEAGIIRVLKEKEVKQTLATSVLQISFLGYTGFRFPIAHYPTNGVTASELFCIIWDIISHLQSWNFVVDFILQDGGDQNRKFMSIHFENDKDASSKCYMSDNLVNPMRKIAHSQDYSHNIKKIRNAILSSGIEKHHTRKIMKGDAYIVWDFWLAAAKWDEDTNSRRIHYKLTPSHLHPDSSEKMRNHLAEEVLNSDMLNLMKHYKVSLMNGNVLAGCIELLENTSKLIAIFRDRRPVISVNDTRLETLRQIFNWFQTWRDETEQLPINSKEKESRLPSKTCLNDIASMISTFLQICQIHISDYPAEGVCPSRYNSDIIENNFCQVRGLHNGNTTNPNYNTYMSTMNTVILGQSSVSRGRKSNAGIPSADPYNFQACVPKKRKKTPFCDITNVTDKLSS